MSGHSKWHRIKHKKTAADNKRGRQFTRLAQQITAAARTNPNLDQNPLLREAVSQAKKANMPQSNIDKLLQKSSSNSCRPVTYEAFGPGGAALLVMACTNNPRRTVAEIRHLLNQYGATLSQPNSVLWKFKQTSPGQFTVQFTQPANPATQSQLAALIQDLLDHPDVQSAFTDTAV